MKDIQSTTIDIKNIKKLIEPFGLNYDELDILEYRDGHESREITLNETRIIEKFIYEPLWLNKFVWLKKVKILQRKSIISYKDFDGGWTYSTYLKPPVIMWYNEKIV